jgi:hypothetical protein
MPAPSCGLSQDVRHIEVQLWRVQFHAAGDRISAAGVRG